MELAPHLFTVNNHASICMILYEPVREKTNNMGSEKVGHKPGCTVTEAS